MSQFQILAVSKRGIQAGINSQGGSGQHAASETENAGPCKLIALDETGRYSRDRSD